MGTGKEQDRAPLIAHVIYRLDVGGLENGVVNLINRIPPQRYRHAVVCLTDFTDFRRRIARDAQVIALGKRPGKDPAIYFRLWRVLRRLRPAIAHTRNLAALEAQLPALLAGVPGRVHGEHGRDMHDLDCTSRKYRVLRTLHRPLVQRYITVSRELADYLRDDVHVPSARITTICNGVDGQRFHPAETNGDVRAPGVLAREGVVPHGAIVIGTIGRIEEVKDQLTLARAFVRLVGLLPRGRERLRLVIIGDGSRRGEIQRYLAGAGCADIAWLPGARDDAAELLRAMDIFVLPSLAEGISNTILEAMASGLPVVATRVGGNAELVAEGETGYLVARRAPEALADAMRRYVDDARLRQEHGRKARARVEREFTIENMVRGYLAVYDQVLRAAGGAGRLGGE